MRKTKVTKEVEKAFDTLSESNSHLKEKIVLDWVKHKDFWEFALQPLKEIDFDTIVALIYGNYEIDLTSEEKALAFYNTSDNYDKKAINEFLKLAEIEFKGITK